MDASKKWYLSKTIWVGFIVFVASLLSFFGIVELELSPEAEWVGIAWGVIQVVLRMVTKEAVIK